MDFELARFNMIEQQIRPWNVLNQRVLDLLGVIKREQFVCPSLQKLAFTDCDLPIRVQGKDTGVHMLSPKMEARLLQELELDPQAKVLEIGTGTGYMAALLAQLCAHVTTVEANPAVAELARQNLKTNGITRVKVIEGCGFEQAKALGQFDAIVMSGASPVLPTVLLDALKPGGRFIGIVGEAPVMQVVQADKNAQGQISQKPLFETQAEVLQNAPKAVAFTF
ncbi:protein-L-isoaspartate O-methyltransferase [Limnobacter humi]|uniref:Protein-L-isoaspartate O-methyltransferase n=1 Tax=Limnobacter humi TaxID=1778671 RepID=A0ABT1WCE4_9BURK|nr:protein-L-isoaspartate O-methyltransferase [Limnobacter humi]MCQ8895186.1 protein-L-isoaspartate O-methyltransferase [Limnobacter humi]